MATNAKNLAELLNTDTTVAVGDIADGSVTTAKLAASAVTTAKVADDAVTTAKLFAENLGRRNVIINGAMEIAQRGTSATGKTGSGIYTVDRMALGIDSLGTWTVTQESLTSGAAYNAGFKKAFRIDCTTADASPASSDNIFFQYKLEGQDLKTFRKGTSSAKQFTLQFWVKSNKTGTGQVLLQDKDNNRFVGKTYTISSANTWEQKILTFPADTTGAFDNDNNKSLEIEWALDAGSNFTSGTLPATWTTGNNTQRSVNDFALGDSTNNDWAITGIQLEAGDTATPFEHRSFGEELALCQRYFCQLVNNTGSNLYLGILQAYNTSSAYGMIKDYPATMRADPSVSQSGNFGGFNYTSGTWNSGSAWGNFAGTSVGWYTGGTGASSNLTAGHAVVIFHVAGSKLMADAEL